MPPHSAVFGHLLAAKEVTDELPPAAHNVYVLRHLSTKVPNRSADDLDAYYFDPAPVNDPLLVVRDPYLAHQVTSHAEVGSLKPPVLADWFAPITGRGGRNLFCSNGAEWKHNTSLFQGFFNNANLDAAVPAIMDQFRLYRDVLRSKAASTPGAMFHLEPMTLLLMNDVIGRLLLNMDLGNQKSGRTHPLSEVMLQQLNLKFSHKNGLDALTNISFVARLRIWNNSRILNAHIRQQIDRQLAEYRQKRSSGTSLSSDGQQDEEEPFKSVLGQAVESFFAQHPAGIEAQPDAAFLEMLCAEIRMFFFAGYDSTVSAMIACVYTVWRHKDVLAKLRAEHDSVFGAFTTTTTSSDASIDRIAQDPNILNQLPYTLAVVKETMRLYPPASGLRPGSPNLVLTGRDGTRYPTAGVLIQLNHIDIQRNPRVWPRAQEFLPERFLVGPGHELYPEKGAFRPFEHGVRNCTGQALVLKELKAFLVLVAREFDFRNCYDEVYKGEKVNLENVDGELPYLIDRGAAHMRGHLPTRIRLSGYASGKTSS
ncbi:cytochrome P450 [Microdochium trichocladiopsis]|uniref:Cytochrome P450 n=1 Tax=Microdochium trichocladiopsis TaxID=1682393 RepID=A0A9P8Y532_9PEZI|nr:cytochrome P450 [Microdochium trichocladiopsis]KAH7029190.1 cytochrome P450 [Microdochium trichocladiopsis]